MKKYLSFSLIILLVTLFSACGSSENDFETTDIPEITLAETGDGIKYKMEVFEVSLDDNDGRPLFEGSVRYPLFFGESDFEKRANKYFSDFNDEFSKRYRADKIIAEYGRPQEVIFREKYDFQISYLKNNIISFAVTDYTFFGKEKSIIRGETADTEEIRLLETEELFTGTDDERQKAYVYYMKEQNPWVVGSGTVSSFDEAKPYITEQGLVFSVYKEKNEKIIKTVIPFSDEKSPIISARLLLDAMGE